MPSSHYWKQRAVLSVLALSVAGCVAPQSQDTGELASGARGPKALTIAIADEPGPLFTNLLGQSMNYATDLNGAVNQRLATYDHRAQLTPELAAELPSEERGTWIVRPDGSMQTTYTLRSDVTWHDGAALTARDFVFGWTVIRDPDTPFSRRLVASQIESIQTPDDFTLVLNWISTYPFANAITGDELGPLPAHLLDATYRAEKDRLPLSAYWTKEYIGLGPYRLANWQEGSHLVLQAYERFYRGRPKIDTIVVRFIPDSQTTLANLLAGAIDGVLSGLSFENQLIVRREWEQAGRTPVGSIGVSNTRFLSVQFRVPQRPELLDANLRRALLHAIDRQAMADSIYAGYAPVMEAFMPPDDIRWEWVKDGLVRYPYDVRRAQELLDQIGVRRGSDGMVRSQAGEELVFPLWTTGGSNSEREIAILGDHWKTLGVRTDLVVLGHSQTRDNALRASFPAFEVTSLPVLQFQHMSVRLHSSTCPTAETRWAGNNRGCYTNAEWDRLIDGLQVAINPNQQQRLYRDLMRLFSIELPLLPLYFTVGGDIFREGVTGVLGRVRAVSGSGGGSMWNVYDWDLT